MGVAPTAKITGFIGELLLKRRGLRGLLWFSFVVHLLSMSQRSLRYEALAKTAPIAIAKMGTTAPAKFTMILWGDVAKATGDSTAALFCACRGSIE
jgi:hypothetical protein